MEIRQCLLTKNDCYTRNASEKKLPASRQDSRYRKYYQGPKGIVVHSTGVNNPWLQRYVQPDDGVLGTNRYGNHWNRPGLDVCVHAFVGRADDGSVRVYQTLPWDYRCWGVGSGNKGSYNDTHIQFEICEDDHASAEYCKETFEAAALLCAYLCGQYGIPVEGIVSHHEAYQQGYGSGHTDPDNWWPKHGLSMDKLRAKVTRILEQEDETMEKEEMRKIAQEAVKSLMDGTGSGDAYSAYAEEATRWAKENGLILGIGGGDYAWKTPMTRQEMVTLLYRFAAMTGLL